MTNPPETNSVRQGKNVMTFKSLSQQLLDRGSYTFSDKAKKKAKKVCRNNK